MNFFKRMIAALVVFLVVIKVLIFDTYAFAAAPIVAETLIEIFGPLLVASGINTQEEVNDMSWGEVSSGVQDGLYNGTINPADVVVCTTVNGVETKMNFMDRLADLASETAAVNDVVDAVIETWWKNLTADDVIPTPVDTTIDTSLYGYGALVIADYKSTLSDGAGSRGQEYFYCDYIIIEESTFTMYSLALKRQTRESGLDDTYKVTVQDLTYSIYEHVSVPSHFYNFRFYGDVRYYDGSAYEGQPEETVNYVGTTADGQPVTLEQIQSGEIPLDDVVIDWEKLDDVVIDWEKLDETALIELMKLIIIELEQVPVIEDDTSTSDDVKEDIQASVAELDISDLNSLKMPLGIFDVFPFCLPVDFVRGMKLLAAEPEVPVFKTVIDFGEINGWDLGEYPIEISFEEWEPVAKVTRWTSLLLFSYVLIFISTKIVKGAGS